MYVCMYIYIYIYIYISRCRHATTQPTESKIAATHINKSFASFVVST